MSIRLQRHLHAGSTEAKYALEDVQAATSAVRSIKETGPDVISRMLKTLENAMAKLPALKTSPERSFALAILKGRPYDVFCFFFL